jgi:hypothetical protein
MFRPLYRPSSGLTFSYYKANYTIYNVFVLVKKIRNATNMLVYWLSLKRRNFFPTVCVTWICTWHPCLSRRYNGLTFHTILRWSSLLICSESVSTCAVRPFIVRFVGDAAVHSQFNFFTYSRSLSEMLSHDGAPNRSDRHTQKKLGVEKAPHFLFAFQHIVLCLFFSNCV